MRWSSAFIPTRRDKPAEAETRGHELMLRAGMIKQLSSGIYSYLPPGYRVIRKLEEVVRQEMVRVGAQELFMPAMQPREIWDETGRWDKYGSNMVKFRDRNNRAYGLAPTHEEAVTDIVRALVLSYRQLPLSLFQIQTKFRDEARPRFGVIRAREFSMKDAYSFDIDEQGLDRSFQAMFDAYVRILQRLRLPSIAVEADSGAIGGTGSVEFMIPTGTGEDQIIYCDGCGYAANIEKAVSRYEPYYFDGDMLSTEIVPTPHASTIDEVSAFFDVPAQRFIKTLIYYADNTPIAALIRGDHEVNEVKLANAVGCQELVLADARTIEEITHARVGFAGPVGIDRIPIYCDDAVPLMRNALTGANQDDAHMINVNYGRDFVADQVLDMRRTAAGDHCTRCDGPLRVQRGIEVGHVFKLGTVYSEPMHATFAAEDGSERPFVMGCYGIGISRLVAAVIETSNDENGIIWPLEIAPYLAVIIPTNVDTPQIRDVAEKMYAELCEEGCEVLIDDRAVSAGTKFKDNDLIGIPVTITVGKNYLSSGLVEYRLRTGALAAIPEETAVSRVCDLSEMLRNQSERYI